MAEKKTKAKDKAKSKDKDADAGGGYTAGSVDRSRVVEPVLTSLKVIQRFKATDEKPPTPPPNAEFETKVMARPAPDEEGEKLLPPPNAHFVTKVWQPRKSDPPVPGIGSMDPNKRR